MISVCVPSCDDETKYILWMLRRFGMHPEIKGNEIIVPKVEEKEVTHLMNAMGKDYDLNKDMTPAVNEFIMGI